MTFTSRDPGVARPEFGQLLIPANAYDGLLGVEAVGLGSTWVVFSAAGYGTDSVLYTVTPSAIELGSNTPRLARGTTSSSFYVYRVGSGEATAALPVTLTSTDPSVVRVLTPSVTLPAVSPSFYASLEGVNVGTASIIVTAPGVTPDTFALQVFPPVLILGSYPGGQTVDPDSSQRSITAYVSDGLYSWYPADTIRAKLRSTNPAALLVTDSVVTFYTAGDLLVGRYVPSDRAGNCAHHRRCAGDDSRHERRAHGSSTEVPPLGVDTQSRSRAAGRRGGGPRDFDEHGAPLHCHGARHGRRHDRGRGGLLPDRGDQPRHRHHGWYGSGRDSW